MAEEVLDLAYVVCSTPRTGSTVLMDMLRSTGVAGHPTDYPDALHHNGIYSIKIQMSQLLPEFKLPVANRHGYIYLYREDVLAQAISWEMAAQTSRWHSYQTKEKDPVYDYAKISLAVQRIQQDNQAWEMWLQDKTPVLNMSYERLSSDPTSSVGEILDFLELPRVEVVPRLTKIGNNLNTEWSERWTEENEQLKKKFVWKF